MVEGYAKDPTNSRSLDELLDLYIQCYNDCVSKHKDKIHFGLHICRGQLSLCSYHQNYWPTTGNFRGSRHFSEGGYDRIATKLFNQLDVQTFYLEYDTPRAGTFEPLQYLPANKNVILGVITSKFPELEDIPKMKERVFSAADMIAKGAGQSRDQALQRLGVSPQCGFASHEEGNAIVWDDMINKLKLVRALADEIWPGEPWCCSWIVWWNLNISYKFNLSRRLPTVPGTIVTPSTSIGTEALCETIDVVHCWFYNDEQLADKLR